MTKTFSKMTAVSTLTDRGSRWRCTATRQQDDLPVEADGLLLVGRSRVSGKPIRWCEKPIIRRLMDAAG